MGRGLTGPVESCGPVLVLGVFWHLDVCHRAFYTLLGHVGPPPGGRRPGSAGVRKELVGVFLGESPEPSSGEAPGCAVFIILAPQPHKYKETMTGILLSPLGLSSGPLHLTLTLKVEEVS